MRRSTRTSPETTTPSPLGRPAKQRRPKPRRRVAAPIESPAADRLARVDGVLHTVYRPGPAPHRLFTTWTRDDDGSLSADALIGGSVTIEDALDECRRELHPDETPYSMVVCEGTTVVAEARLLHSGTVVERFDEG